MHFFPFVFFGNHIKLRGISVSRNSVATARQHQNTAARVALL